MIHVSNMTEERMGSMSPTTTPTTFLDTLRIASPCAASWGAMKGDDRSRFCGECSLNVYNISAMSRAEAEALVRAKEGRLCVRFVRRADGTVLTEDCPVGLRAARRKLARAIGRAAAVFMVCAASIATGGCKNRNGIMRSSKARQWPVIGRALEWLDPTPPPTIRMMTMGEVEAPSNREIDEMGDVARPARPPASPVR